MRRKKEEGGTSERAFCGRAERRYESMLIEERTWRNHANQSYRMIRWAQLD